MLLCWERLALAFRTRFGKSGLITQIKSPRLRFAALEVLAKFGGEALFAHHSLGLLAHGPIRAATKPQVQAPG